MHSDPELAVAHQEVAVSWFQAHGTEMQRMDALVRSVDGEAEDVGEGQNRRAPGGRDRRAAAEQPYRTDVQTCEAAAVPEVVEQTDHVWITPVDDEVAQPEEPIILGGVTDQVERSGSIVGIWGRHRVEQPTQ